MLYLHYREENIMYEYILSAILIIGGILLVVFPYHVWYVKCMSSPKHPHDSIRPRSEGLK